MPRTFNLRNDATSRGVVVLALVLLLGLGLRLALLFASGFAIESDEAVVGLMGKHIAAGQAFPVFYYGQDYMGSLEPMLVAVGFALFGQSAFVLKAVPLAFSLLHILLVYLIARCFVPRRDALWAGLLCAVAPHALLLWSTKARGGFIELVVLGSLALLLSLKLFERRTVEYRLLFAIGFVLGVGWWVNNQIAFYMLPIGLIVGLFVLVRGGLTSSVKSLLLVLAAFLFGGLPFWVANVFGHPAWASFEVLFGNSAGDKRWNYLAGFFSEALPIILGSRRFWSNQDVLPAASTIAFLVYAVAVVLVLVPRGVLARGDREAEKGNAVSSATYRWGLSLLLLFCLSVPLIFASSSFGWLSRAPRYLLPLYSVIFVFVAIAVAQLRRMFGSALATGFGGLFLVLNICSGFYGGVATSGQPMVYRGVRVSEDQLPLYKWLQEQGYSHIWTNYWIGYRAAFETDEKITFSRVGRPRSLRIPRYESEEAVQGKPAVYVMVAPEAAELERQFQQFGFEFRRTLVGEYVVLDKLKPKWLRGPQIDLEGVRISSELRMDWLPKIHDDSLETRWGSGHPQYPGMSIVFEFPEPTGIAGMDIELGQFVHDAPRHLVVEGMDASGNWQKLLDTANTKVFFDLLANEFAEIPPVWRFYFPGVTVKKLRLKQLGSTAVFDWSLAEIRLYGLSEKVKGELE